VHLRSDSLLLVNQLSGIYRVKTPHLQPLHREVRGLIAALSQVKVEHVPREMNKDADRLANLGVDTMLAARRRR
jgi:ribonuclease HI